MSLSNLRIHQIATQLTRVLRIPTLIVIGWVLGLVALDAILLLGLRSSEKAGTLATVVITGLLLLCALPAVVLAVLRARWMGQLARTPGPTSHLIGQTLDEEAEELLNSLDEFGMTLGYDRGIAGRATTWLSQGKWRKLGGALMRTEQLQRAVTKAAGGQEAAPYLRTDWRLILLSALGSCLAIMVAIVIVIILFLWWIVPV